jgi:hypothetical protein
MYFPDLNKGSLSPIEYGGGKSCAGTEKKYSRAGKPEGENFNFFTSVAFTWDVIEKETVEAEALAFRFLLFKPSAPSFFALKLLAV